jgi:hypothetical protein
LVRRLKARCIGSDAPGPFSTSWVLHHDVDPMVTVTCVTLNAAQAHTL